MQVVYQDLNVKCVILAALQSYDTYPMSDTPVPFRAADTIWLFNHTHKLHQVLQSHIRLILQLHPELQSQFSLHWNHLIIAHTQHWWHTTQLLGWWMATKSIIHNWQSLAIHYRYGQQHIPVYTGRSAANKWWFLPQIKAFACLLADCRLFYMGQLSGTSVLMSICSADNWPV